MAYQCQWYDPDARAICSYASMREWNTQRHMQQVHKSKYDDGLEAFGHRIQIGTAIPVHVSKTAKAYNYVSPMSAVHVIVVPLGEQHKPIEGTFLASQHAEIFDAIQPDILEVRTLLSKRLDDTFKLRQQRSRRLVSTTSESAHEHSRIKIWNDELIVGITVNPMFEFLHVHVLSQEYHSLKWAHKDHYYGFTKPRFINLAELPLSENQLRSRTVAHQTSLCCTRCGKEFGSNLELFKGHLEEEFEDMMSINLEGTVT